MQPHIFLNFFKSLTTVELDSASDLDHANTKGMFRGCVLLNKFVISDSTITLPESAFEGCVSLTNNTSIDLQNFRFEYGREFYGCIGLNGIVLTASSIPESTFEGCEALKLITASNLTTVGERAFYGTGFTEVSSDVQFPALEVIGKEAFANCKSIVTVNLQKLEGAGEGAFSGCTVMTTVTLPELGSIPAKAFKGDTSLTTVSIGNAGSIGVQAFQNCSGLIELSLPAVTIVGDVETVAPNAEDSGDYSVFSGCSKLKKVSMPKVEEIGAFAFYNCSTLSSFNADSDIAKLNGVTYVGYAAMSNTSFTGVTVGKDAVNTDIGDRAFEGCTSMKSFELIGGIGSIGGNSLNGCSLINSLTIPISANWISEYKSSTLKSIHFTVGTDPAGHEYVDQTYTNTFWYNSRNYTVTFDEGITSIGAGMRLSATGSVVIPATVKSVGSMAFYGAPMTSVTMSEGLTSIGDQAFANCTGLKTAVIPNSIVTIGSSAFEGCTALSSIQLPITVDYSKNTFVGCTALRTFRFTKGDNGVGKGYTEHNVKNTPWYLNSVGGATLTVTFDSGITSIGDNMFRGCTGITGDLTLPSTINHVGCNAFDGVLRITALNVEAASIIMEESAFKGCTGIKTLIIPVGLNVVGYANSPIFEKCSGITSIHFTGAGSGHIYTENGESAYTATPWYLSRNNTITVTFDDGITSIGDNMFRDCSGLSGTVLCTNVVSVGSHAFSGCINLVGFESDALTTLGEEVFRGARSLVSVDLSGITELPAYTFYDCTELTSIMMDQCRTIGEHAFERSGIKNINGVLGVELATVTQIGDYAFAHSAVERIVLGSQAANIALGDGVLMECPYLKDVTIAGKLNALPKNTFISGDNPSFSSPLRTFVANQVQTISALFTDFKSLTTVEIAGTTSLDADKTRGMFKGCTALKTVTLYQGNNSVALPESAFEGCTSLTTINLDSFTLNGGREFYGCASLESVNLSSATKVPQNAFYGCGDLTEIVAPKVNNIAEFAFASSGLTSILKEVFPVATQIGEGAFQDCKDLTFVEFANVSAVGDAVFKGCTDLESVSLPEVTEITNSMFYNCSSLKEISADNAEKVRELSFYGCRSIIEITLPSVREIGDIAASTSVSIEDYVTKAVFSNCVSLSKVSMENLRSIGALAFYGCSTLVSFNADDSYDLSDVTEIRFGAFSGSGVTDVIVGKSNGISDIGDYAFYNCPRLANFTSESLRTLPEHLFNNTDVNERSSAPMIATITVPSVQMFYANLHGCTYLTKVIAPKATAFNPDTFYGCTLLQSVTLMSDANSEERVTLSTRMFYGCERLASIDLTNALFDGAYTNGSVADTFNGCKALRTIVMPVATKVPSGAFSGCTNITSVYAPVATVIGSDAFNGCISLGYVDMPVATAVHDRAFKDCSSLSEINADTGLNPFINISDIRSEAFYRCGFTDLVLGPNLIGLGASAFAYNPLVEVVIPNSSGTLIIGDKAFQGCPLEDVHISSSVGRIGANAFDYSTVLGIDEANFWFNGSINSGLMMKNSIVGNNHMSVVINADADSSSFVSKFEANGFVTNANVDYIERYIATIQFQTTESGIPSINTMFAIYGGKIVLPYISYGTNYGDVAFATLDGLNNHLSIYASDADYSAKHIARSGDAVPVYPMGDHDSMVFLGSKNTANFIDDMVINTESFGYDVNIEEQTVHYGSIVTVPQFYDSLMNVKGLSVVRYDDVTYNMSIDATEFRAGYYFEYIVIMSEETTIEVWFISKGESVKADVMIQAAFEVPTELKYLESPNAGYSFGGWWTSEGGKGIKAGADTKFAIGQRWYAHFVPLEYTLTIVSDNPEYSAEFTVTGPFSLHVVNNSLYYRDTVNTTNKLVFDATSITGYSVSTYTDRNNFGRVITGDYVPSVGNMIVDLFMDMNEYEIQLKFTYEGAPISDGETFIIDGWDVGIGNQFHTGSVISSIPYTMIKDGLYMPLPVHNEYAFGEMNTGSMAVPFVNGKYTLTLDNFNGQTSAVVTYVMLKDQYTIQFMLQDDDDTQFTNSVSITIGDTFMMPSVVRNYSKTGFLFDYLSIDGIDKRYQEREPVVLTQEMADNAKFCVVIVRAQWTPISYDIQFDLAPFTGTASPVEGVIIGQEIPLPVVSGYPGYRVSGWHWVLGDSVSDSFTDNVILTKDIVAGYADDTTIVMHVEWSAKKYNLAVDPSSGYKFDVKTATFGENVTLWKNTYNRSFMKFAGWGIGDTVYGDGATVVLDTIMAEAGDSNSDTILFKMSWIHNEYQVQYNLDGGEGQIPVDDNAYIVNQTEFNLAVYDESFYQEGYSFVGWKYSKSSYIVYTNTTGLFETVLAQYADENNIVTFYAVWSQKSYKISYDLAGGRAGLNAPTNVFYGDEIDVSKPTRAGYDFAGWTATGLTGGALYSSSAGYRGWDGEKQVTSTSFMDLCNVDGGVVTLTAHWDQATYLVSYNLNGGSGVVIGGQIQIKVGDVIVQPTLRDANKTGYKYAGWGVDQVNALPSGATFTSDMVSDIDNTLVLYAIWDPIQYTVQYRYIDGYAYTTLNVEFGETITLPNLDRSGYTFKGWNITGADANAYYSKDGSTWYRLGTTDVDGMYFRNLTSTDGSIITMEATWSTNEYRISYNSNGGTGKAPVDTNVYRVGDMVQLQDYTVLSGTNGSKSVVGWSLEPNGSSVIIVEFTEGLAMQADATGAINLYAVWVDGMCTVIVDLDGATVSMTPAGWLYNANGTYEKIVDYGSDTGKVMADWNNVTVEKDGYNFTGWNYSSATITSTVTVEPIFEEVNMSVLYVFGGVIATFVVGAVIFTRF